MGVPGVSGPVSLTPDTDKKKDTVESFPPRTVNYVLCLTFSTVWVSIPTGRPRGVPSPLKGGKRTPTRTERTERVGTTDDEWTVLG